MKDPIEELAKVLEAVGGAPAAKTVEDVRAEADRKFLELMRIDPNLEVHE